VSTHRPGARRLLTVVSNWGWLALLRGGLALVLALFAATYQPDPGTTMPPHVTPTVYAIAGVLALLALLQARPRFRGSRNVAILGLVADTAAVLGASLLYAFDPNQFVPALLVVVQAEGGVVLGLGGGFLAWGLTSAAYVWIGVVNQSVNPQSTHVLDETIRIGVGLILALGGGLLADELSGERDRRMAVREQELRKLQENEARYRSLVEEIPVVTYVDAADRTSSTIYISPRVEEWLGYSPNEWISDAALWSKLLHHEDREWVMTESLRTNATREPFKAEYRLVAKDGSVVWVRDEAVLIRDDQGRPEAWQGVMVDITERKRAEEEIAFLAYHDELTGLPNRLTFERTLDLAIARARRRASIVAVLFVDLDDFKRVNDTLGHAAGDELLKQVADRLAGAVRDTDVVARHAGDEFLVLLGDLETLDPEAGGLSPLAQAERVADRIHRALDRPFHIGASEARVTASIGLSRFPIDADTPKDLLNKADTAMYKSKRRAPAGSVVFSSGDEAE
jgi:diguanylate cyclase (GGDEF)-like protein/PAS domain S-box-containing protein